MARVGDFYRQRSMIRDQEEEGFYTDIDLS
jgi:hypothetical protein